MIDLRSDTVTRPTLEMREFMAKAEVGDDGYHEDPSINRLQDISKGITGKEDALYLPTGTMANIVAIMSHTRPSDSIVLGQKAHSWLYESGSPAAIAGVLPVQVGVDGTFTWKDVEENALGGDVHLAPTTLIMMENTHNGGGGIVFPQSDIEDISEKARFWGYKTHIDGARIFNASIASQKSVLELAAPVDSISFCLSKGLGCPVGSVLCGSAAFIQMARRYRELLGGGMRQAGIVASAGIYALENNIERLQDDHDNAKLLAEKISEIDGLETDLVKVQSNMVFVAVKNERLNAVEYAGKLKENGVLVNAFEKHRFRAVTHLEITRDDILKAVSVFKEVLAGL
jgi:threonine aldolase